MELGECVLRKRRENEETLESLFNKGLWLGRSTETGEHFVGAPAGVMLARAVRPLSPERRWGRQLTRAMRYTPWLISLKSRALGPLLAVEGWTPTEGCVGCMEEEVDPLQRRVGRPSHHAPALLERLGGGDGATFVRGGARCIRARY